MIRPALLDLRLHSPAAERLLLGTALTESGLSALAQDGVGPALGVYQIEPATHQDVWRNYLAFRPALAWRVGRFAGKAPRRQAQLITNLSYATVVARLIYRRRPEPLPGPGDLGGLAAYWKAHFNTTAGRGGVEDFMARAAPTLRALYPREQKT